MGNFICISGGRRAGKSMLAKLYQEWRNTHYVQDTKEDFQTFLRKNYEHIYSDELEVVEYSKRS